MPLIHSSSKAALKENMRVLHGEVGRSPHVKSHAQATAIALATQRRAAAGYADGGVVEGYDIGGGVAAPLARVAPMMNPTQVNPATVVRPSMPAPMMSMPQAGRMLADGGVAANHKAHAALAIEDAARRLPDEIPPDVLYGIRGIAPSRKSGDAMDYVPASIMGNGDPRYADKTLSFAEGGVAARAMGGPFNMAQGPNLRPPWEERSAARQMHVGPVLSAVPGRTDNHQVRVPAGAYVMPAAHVSSLGQGNTMAGMSVLGRMFGTGPYGTAPMKMGHGHLPTAPRPPMPHFADGGYSSQGGARGTDHFTPVNVDISGGEYVIPPQVIIAKFGSLKRGHAILDHWIMETRKKEIATQKKLPPPAKE